MLGPIWSGDYSVTESEPMLKDVEAPPCPIGKVRVHRIKEVCKPISAPVVSFAIIRDTVYQNIIEIFPNIIIVRQNF